jgi:hypothetical protein
MDFILFDVDVDVDVDVVVFVVWAFSFVQGGFFYQKKLVWLCGFVWCYRTWLDSFHSSSLDRWPRGKISLCDNSFISSPPGDTMLTIHASMMIVCPCIIYHVWKDAGFLGSVLSFGSECAGVGERVG